MKTQRLLYRPLITTLFLGLVAACSSHSPRYDLSSKEVAYAPSPTAPPPASGMVAEMEVDVPHNTERYAHIAENDFKTVADSPLSTFSIDVDTASYSNVRRFLQGNRRPPADAVRIEELINYFSYEYPQPQGDHPFSVISEVAPAPWNPEHQLVHIGLQGKDMHPEEIPGRNLVFLIDVSGSMSAANKLPLLKDAFELLIENLTERDRISMVVYAGASGVVLEPTPGDDHDDIMDAFDELSAGGSTNGAAGIQLAYNLAEEAFIKGGINRVILATDGDFNVGTTDEGSLVRLLEKKRDKGIFLTILGFGMGNLNDSTMEAMADHGNGNYAYIDTLREAQKVLVNEAASTLVTIAKDTKLQIEFNPVHVQAYRLIGYENRLLNNEDFADDKKDAGDLGAGHSVTAIYEVVPTGSGAERSPKVAPLKYQSSRHTTGAASTGEVMTVKLRYKDPDASESKLLTRVVRQTHTTLGDTSDDFRFSAAVAGFGMLLRDSKHSSSLSWADVRSLAKGAMGEDPFGYRGEFLELVDAARGID